MSNQNNPEQRRCAVPTGSAALAIEALERLASQHIDAARVLGAMQWRYDRAREHRAEAAKLCEMIAEIAKPEPPTFYNLVANEKGELVPALWMGGQNDSQNKQGSETREARSL